MKIFLIISIGFILICMFWYYENNVIGRTRYKIKHKKIADDISGYKIIQISDLHNKYFGEQILNKIKKENPDMIVITGDLLDSRHPNVESILLLLEDLLRIAPVYFVSGNHEARFDDIDEIKKEFRELGVIVLENNTIEIVQNKSSFTLIGLEDQMFSDVKEFQHNLEYLCSNNELFSILLTHRPEYFEMYSEHDVDLILTGHAHGGQFRIPIINKGLFTPWEGMFPKYTQGIHQKNNTQMIISRGLGPSKCPLRLFNRPELVVITLEKEEML